MSSSLHSEEAAAAKTVLDSNLDSKSLVANNDDKDVDLESVLVLVDVENVRGVSQFELTHDALLGRAMAWMWDEVPAGSRIPTSIRFAQEQPVKALLVLVVDHGTQRQAWDLQRGTAIVFSGPGQVVKADDVLVALVMERVRQQQQEAHGRHRTFLITADMELIDRCQRSYPDSANSNNEKKQKNKSGGRGHSDHLIVIPPREFVADLWHYDYADHHLWLRQQQQQQQGTESKRSEVDHDTLENEEPGAHHSHSIPSSPFSFHPEALRREMQARRELLSIRRQLYPGRSVSKKKRTKLLKQKTRATERLARLLLREEEGVHQQEAQSLRSIIHGKDDGSSDDDKADNLNQESQPRPPQPPEYPTSVLDDVLKSLEVVQRNGMRVAETTQERRLLAEGLRRRLSRAGAIPLRNAVEEDDGDDWRKQELRLQMAQILQQLWKGTAVTRCPEGGGDQLLLGRTAPTRKLSYIEQEEALLKFFDDSDESGSEKELLPPAREPSQSESQHDEIQHSEKALNEDPAPETKETHVLNLPVLTVPLAATSEEDETKKEGNSSSKPNTKWLRIIAISDTHGFEDQLMTCSCPDATQNAASLSKQKLLLPPADILIHCGDFYANPSGARRGKGRNRLDSFLAEEAAHIPLQVVIRGNHDPWEQQQEGCSSRLFARSQASYITHPTLLMCRGVRMALIPYAGDYLSHNAGRSHCDIVVTHEPPHGICDVTYDGRRAGSVKLRRAADSWPDPPPRLWLCGHIHEGRGVEEHAFGKSGDTTMVANVANANPGRVKRLVSGAVMMNVEVIAESDEDLDDGGAIDGADVSFCSMDDVSLLAEQQPSLDSLVDVMESETSQGQQGGRLLAVDLGPRKTALAVLEKDGSLAECHVVASRGFHIDSLRQMVLETYGLTHVILEGQPNLLAAWKRAVQRSKSSETLQVARLPSGEWREALLTDDERRNSRLMKEATRNMAQQIELWSQSKLKKAKSTTTAAASLEEATAADAVVMGHYAAFLLGWIPSRGAESPILGRAGGSE